ncbi:MAG TPA: hypothetical protein VEQ18_04470, partial [Candidatus Nitrosocosmicus sp.]|nr:hypothetical protein [Candidatus Nitrosocosmicus sp.]
IQVQDCNPAKDINSDKPIIQTQDNSAHIYDETGKHLISISTDRLEWLWKKYFKSKNLPHDLMPPIQTFEIEMVWLYQRYKYRTPKIDPLKNSHHSLPNQLLDHIITS